MKTFTTGRAGEFFVAYKLQLANITVFHVDIDKTDLICQMPCGALTKVQVKYCHHVERGKNTYRFVNKNSYADDLWVCCVAGDVERLLMLSPEETQNRRTKSGTFRINKTRFTKDNEASTIDAFLLSVK